MKLWIALYTMVWIALIEYLLVMTPGGSSVLIYLHSVLGIAIIGLAFYNFSGIRKTRVMGRVKRIAQASYNISVTAGISGVMIFFDIGKTPIIPMINTSIYGIILFFHVICAFAIITQAAAIAICGRIKSSKRRQRLELCCPIPCSRKVNDYREKSSRQWRKLYAKNHTMFMV